MVGQVGNLRGGWLPPPVRLRTRGVPSGSGRLAIGGSLPSCPTTLHLPVKVPFSSSTPRRLPGTPAHRRSSPGRRAPHGIDGAPPASPRPRWRRERLSAPARTARAPPRRAPAPPRLPPDRRNG